MMNEKTSILDNYKHGQAIYRMFEPHFERWMTENDKVKFIEKSVAAMGGTLAQLDADIETGVRNGYSEGFQINFFHEQLGPAKGRNNAQ